MLGMYVHAPDLTEIGGFYGTTAESLLATEKALKTQFAVASTTPGQADSEKLLRNANWMDLGHRYNQYHGPNFITLWAKEFPANTKPQKLDVGGCGWYYGDEKPPAGAFSCGIWVAHSDFAKLGKTLVPTRWLAIWRIPDLDGSNRKLLVKNSWNLLGETALGAEIWHTAQPHDNLDKLGGPR